MGVSRRTFTKEFKGEQRCDLAWQNSRQSVRASRSGPPEIIACVRTLTLSSRPHIMTLRTKKSPNLPALGCA